MTESGRLTTHVLDTAHGYPAANLDIALYRLEDGSRTQVAKAITNPDGRCDGPLLSGESMREGTYVLAFGVGAYFEALLGEPSPFLGTVVVQFDIADASQHFHVPLLVSPFGYSTYRGS